MVIFRENTEAEYSGFEQEVTSGVVQSLKIVTRYGSIGLLAQFYLSDLIAVLLVSVLPRPLSVMPVPLAASVCTPSTRPTSSAFRS